jgi:hypothetical protein
MMNLVHFCEIERASSTIKSNLYVLSAMNVPPVEMPTNPTIWANEENSTGFRIAMRKLQRDQIAGCNCIGGCPCHK